MPKRYIVVDFISLQEGKRHINHAGFLVAPNSSIARSGILQYVARDIGMEGDPDEVISVYRPREEILKALKKYANMPVTTEHPQDKQVVPETAKGLQVGHVGSNITSKELLDKEIEVLGDIIITDKEAIEGITGKKRDQLSAGYHSSYRYDPGTAPDGTPYKVIQYDLVPNHVAVVKEGRCGSHCRVADSSNVNKNGEQLMLIEIAGKQYEVSEEAAQALLAAGAATEPVSADMDPNPNKTTVKPVVPDAGAAAPAAAAPAAPMAPGVPEDGEAPVAKPVDAEGKEYEEKDKETGDSVILEIELPNGKKAACDAATLAYITELGSDPDKGTVAVDAMQMAVLASDAGRILGSDFDISGFKTADEIKVAIVKKALPAADEKQFGNSEVLNVLYKTAVDSHKVRGEKYNEQLSFLGGEQKPTVVVAADGTTTTQEVSPIAGLIKVCSAPAAKGPSVDSADPHNPSVKVLKFAGQKKKENK